MKKPSRKESDDPPAPVGEDTRTGIHPDTLARALVENLYYIQGKPRELATLNDWYVALAYTVRDRLLERWVATVRTLMQRDVRAVCYFSAEFLMGPHLGNSLLNLGIAAEVREAVAKVGQDLDQLIEQETEPGLGNGGLGRLAACFLDSLATLEIPAIGYGIRYEFGIFDQEIHDGRQVEVTDKWLSLGNPWEIPRPELEYHVSLGGRRAVSRRSGAVSGALGARADRQGRRLRHPGPGLPRRHHEPPQALEGRSV